MQEYYQRSNNVGPEPLYEKKATSSQGPKLEEKRSYHLSTVDNYGEGVIEEQSVTEDGVQVVHNTTYKKKVKWQKHHRQEFFEKCRGTSINEKENSY